MPVKLTTEEFIKRAKEMHGDKYDYSLVEYKTNKIKIKILCNKHGIFEQTPKSHLSGYGCQNCANDNLHLSKEQFIIDSNKIYNNKYDYSLVQFNLLADKVKIICPIHGIFEQRANDHKQGAGCLKCYRDSRKNTIENFIKSANQIHETKYDYSKAIYPKDNKTKIEIICKIHGSFFQSPNNHLRGTCCPKCAINSSKIEEKIAKWFNIKNIKYIRQYLIDGCVGKKRRLPFDFYLPEYNICIEYDGYQHYNPKYGKIQLNKTKRNDLIKTNFCLENNIKLIRIPYWETKKLFEILAIELKISS